MENNKATLLDVFTYELHSLSRKFTKMEDSISIIETKIGEFKSICSKKHNMTNFDIEDMVIGFKQEDEETIDISINEYAFCVLSGIFLPSAIFHGCVNRNVLTHPITNKETKLSKRYIKIKLLKVDEESW